MSGTTFLDEELDDEGVEGYLLILDLGESQWWGDGGNSFGCATVELKQKDNSIIGSMLGKARGGMLILVCRNWCKTFQNRKYQKHD